MPESRHSGASTEPADSQVARHMLLQVLGHGGVALLLASSLALVAAAETGGRAGPAIYLAALWAFLCGLALSHIVHEWGHFAGAFLARSRLTIKSRLSPLFFDFDYQANTSRQFLAMSMGGLAGNLLLLGALFLFAAPGSLVFASLLAAVAGQLVFVLALEGPVSRGVLAGGDPLQTLTAHFGQGGPLFLRATAAGVSAAALLLLFYRIVV